MISKTAIASKTKLGFLTAKQGEASNAAPFQLGVSIIVLSMVSVQAGVMYTGSLSNILKLYNARQPL